MEVSAQFPAGLILEILAGHGLDMTELVDGFFRSTEDKRLAYYDHPVARPYIESDTLGLLLRLYKHSGQTERNEKILGDYLELLHSMSAQTVACRCGWSTATRPRRWCSVKVAALSRPTFCWGFPSTNHTSTCP